MRGLRLLILLLLLVGGCGRAGVDSLRNATRDSLDAQANSGPDIGLAADAGNMTPETGGSECRSADDCPAVPGDYCPDGQVDRWRCDNGRCLWTCLPANPPAQSCNNDCDCPIGLVCGGRECVAADRPNLCCNYEPCPPGRTCVRPDGTRSACGMSASDAGPSPGFDGGAPPSRDASMPSVPRDAGTGCTTDCDCDFRFACIGGSCVAAGRINQCCDNPQCPPGVSCVQANGTMSVCPTQVPVGNACVQSTQCTALGICIEPRFGFPDGYCSQYCAPGTLPCPGDAVCRQVGADEICLDGCAADSDCRLDYVCTRFGLGTDKVCWPRGPSSMNPAGEPVGGPCGNDGDCAQGLTCIQQQAGSWRGGYCTISYCDATSNLCPANTTCYAFPQWFPICLSTCPNAGSQSTCRNGYYCLGPAGQAGVCMTQ